MGSKQFGPMSPVRRKLLEKMLAERGLTRAGGGGIPRREGPGPWPLSSGQQRLWVLEQMQPGGAYNMVHAVRLSGRLDAAALRQALARVVARHEALRTTFEATADGPVQIVHADLAPVLVEERLAEPSREAQEARIAELARAEAAAPFDLVTGPLLRVRLLELGDAEHVLLLTMHHIVSDGWSMGVLVRELAGAVLAGDGGLVELPLQYPDYAVWQRRRLETGQLDAHVAFFAEALRGAPPTTELIPDRARPAVQSHAGARLVMPLKRERIERIEAVGREQQATLFMSLWAAFAALVGRRIGSHDVVLGTPVAGRTSAQTEELIGFFVNTVALRLDLSGDPPFVELLARARAAAQAAFEHQDAPFERVVEALSPPRDPSRSPVFQMLFVLHNAPPAALEVAGVRLEPLDVDVGTAQFDLSLSFEPQSPARGGGLDAVFLYNRDLFDRETIAVLAEQLRLVLDAVAASPAIRLSELPLFPEAHRERIASFNRTQVAWEQAGLVPELIAEQVRRTPDAPALSFAHERLSYADMLRRACGLARALRARGVGPDVPVGICVERSLELLLALVAVLEAGGAYVPLDPSYPQERLERMARDAGVRFALSDAAGIAALGEPDGMLVMRVEEAFRSADDAPWQPPRLSPDNLAYVLFTSGSTGRPKGVLCTHGGLKNRLLWMQSAYRLGSADRVLQKTPASFDVSGWEFFWPLITGAELVIARPGGHQDSAYLADTIAERGITVMHFVPSMLRIFLEEQGLERCGSLRALMASGEALPPELVTRVAERLQCPIHNLYGPTEAAIDVTAWACEPDPRARTVPIGRPIANVQMHVLDAELRPAPLGVVGELYIGGVQLARGYAGRADLTAERFVPDAEGRSGQRLYRTGDLGRWRHDGALEYVGRADHQVKLRGYRIELGEIEAALLELGGVREAVVVVRADASGSERLVAYVVPSAAFSADTAQAALKNRLPAYMIPSAFVTLKELPIGPTGKLDRKALPQPDEGARRAHAAFAPPRTAVEELLLEVFCDVLAVPSAGIDDNFFDLGGDSIRAIAVRARAQQAGLSFTVTDLFRLQTVRELARAAERVGRDAIERPLEPFALVAPEDRRALPTGVVDAYPLSKLLEGFVFHSEYGGDYAVYVMTFHVRAAFDAAKLRAVAEAVVRRHPFLRSTFELTDYSVPLQLVYAGMPVQIEVEDWRALDDDEQERRLEPFLVAETHHRFDWRTGPLWRLFVHRRADDRFQLTIVHPFLDGWSAAQVVAELGLGGLGGVDLDALPPLAASYADFVVREQAALDDPDTRALWQERLARYQPSRLPREPMPEGEPRMAVESVHLHIDPETTRGLEALARSAALPLKSVLLAAHAKVLAVVSGTTRAGTGMLFNGRPELSDGDRVVGQFTNALPLTIEVLGGSFRDLARRAFEAELEILPHRRYPMAELHRAFGRNALFDTLFNFTHFHVYEGLGRADGVEVLSVWATDQDYVPLVVRSNINPATDALEIWLDYRTSELTRPAIERLAAYYERILVAMVRDPDAPHDAVSVLDDGERSAVLVEPNRSERAYPTELCLHQLVAEQVRRRPDAVAVSAGDARLGYAELGAASSRLAARLRQLGARPGVRVGVCSARSPQMMVALLAILESGAAYVPLDPDFPAERLAFMLADSGVDVVVGTRPELDALSAQGRELVRIDVDEVVQGERAAPPVPASLAGPEDLAYVIYTSGSTGLPKGVEIPHRAVVNFLCSMREQPGIAEDDVLAAVTTLSFDIAVLELFLPLIAGARVELVAADVARDGERLGELVARVGATMMQATPSTWRLLLAAGWQGAPLRALCGGEAWPPALAAQLRPRVGSLFNMYGPTETTIWSTLDAVEDGGEVLIGRPIANTTAYVLDAALQPAPLGVPGELYLGGHGLARGYHARPDLAAERFLPDPFGPPGARIYRTGDLVRRRADGRLEYIARADDQVKVRGYRIELGEIESVLSTHPRVREAAAVVKRGADGDARLVAYVASDAPDGLRDELVALLESRLPGYMVPSAIAVLEALPKTPNRKIDKKSLPGLDHQPRAGRAFVAPRGPVEEAIAAVWSEVLGTSPVGSTDHFFELGGHSLLATQAVSRIRRALSIELPLKVLFDQPRLADLALEAERRMGLPSASPEPIGVIDRAEELVLSFGQERMWFLSQLEPTSPFYNMPGALRLVGAVEVEVLRASLRALMLRHEVLRTHYRMDDGRPVLVIAPEAPDVLALVDLSELAPAERARALDDALRDEAQRPFDLAEGPILRAKLIRVGGGDDGKPEEHVLVLNVHHIAADIWSVGIIQRELVALYHAENTGRPADLPELPFQYADYAAWQRAFFEGPRLEEELAYWRRQLAGAPPEIDLPFDRGRPTKPSYHGDRVPLRLRPELSSAVEALARRTGATPFMVLLAAFYFLLWRTSGQKDLVVGTPIAGRTRADTEGLVGFFVNTLALRVELDGDPSFAELVERVKQTALDAYLHQEVPFERVVEAVNPGRSLAKSPLFQVMFAFMNAPGAGVDLGDLRVEPIDLDRGSTRFDLTLVMSADAGLSGFFEYSTELFDGSTVERLAARFERALGEALARPEAALSRLAFVTADEERELEHLSGEAVALPERCVHESFVARAAETPDAVALALGERTMSYAQLERASRRVAGALRGLGVQRGDLVAICMERSFEAIVSVMAVLRAGAAYLPLDPATPAPRVAFMLEDARPALLLVHGAIPPGAEGALTIVQVADLKDHEPPPPESLPRVSLDDGAYAIFTSGSTGNPKAVLVPHLGLANVVARLVELLHTGPGDRVMQFVSLSFDVSASEIFKALTSGAALVLAPQVALLPGPPLLSLLREQRVTTISLPGSVLVALPPTPLPDLRALIVGGEVCPHATVDTWYRGRRMYNCYGPTEASICATYAECDAEGHFAGIGRPVSGARCYVIDARIERVPVGIAGELAIGGIGVARGYLGRPELTAARFVPDPFSGVPGARMYLTGDRARFRSDGCIEFLGRLDAQVKIRGHRVEVGESEAALLEHPAVSEAAVIPHDDVHGVRRLIAYLVLRDAAPEAAELRAFLEDRLPDYMVPAVFVPLPSLPRTAGGKLDKRSLPEPDGRALRGELVAPRTELEQKLVAIWEAALGVSPIGVTDNFFDIGGNSFLILRLLTEVRRVFGESLPLSSVFESGTVAKMAGLLEDRWSRSEVRSLVPMRPRGQGAPVFLVHPVGGNVLCYGQLARLIDKEHPVYGFQARGAEGGLPPRDDLSEMASAYVAELVDKYPEGPCAIFGWSFGGTVAYEMARQLSEQGREVPLLGLLDSNAPVAQRHEIDFHTLMFVILHDLVGMLGAQLPPLEAMRSLSREAIEELAVESVKNARLFPEGTERAEVHRHINMYRTHMNAHLRYRPQALEGSILYFVAGDSAHKHNIVARWRALTAGAFDLVHLPDSKHNNLLLRPNVQQVASCINQRLAALR